MKWGTGKLEIEVAWNDDREHWVKTNRVFVEECGGIKISELTNEQVEEANVKAIQAFAHYLQDVNHNTSYPEEDTNAPKDIEDLKYRLTGLTVHIAERGRVLHELLYEGNKMASMFLDKKLLDEMEEMIQKYRKTLKEYEENK